MYSVRSLHDHPAGAADAGNGGGGLRLGYYSESCPRAEDIVKEQVAQLYHKHGNTAVSWLRALFHDCMVRSCDASLLLEPTTTSVSEKASRRSFGMRNFKYIDVIKAAVEQECLPRHRLRPARTSWPWPRGTASREPRRHERRQSSYMEIMGFFFF